MALILKNITTPATGLGLLGGAAVVSPVKVAGQWYYNITENRTAAGDFEFPRANWSLDTSNAYNNVNVGNIVNTTTSTFAITIIVPGVYNVTFSFRGSLSVPGASTQSYATYISGHVLNGISYTPIGTVASIANRITELDAQVSNTQTAAYSPGFHHTVNETREFKAGDTFAPSCFMPTSSWQIAGSTTAANKLTTFRLVLLKQTGPA